jgi:predicted dehydrogenase
MLDFEPLDAVLVFSDNSATSELGGWALDHGLHTMIERPMATSVAGAEAMIAASRQGNARLMTHWSIAFWPQLQAAVDLAVSGQLGHIYQVKYRAAHPGPREMGFSSFYSEWLIDPTRGGGALLDCTSFGVALARTILGQPEKVTGLIGNYCKEALEVEDNATVLMHYPRATAIAEGSWCQVGELTSYVAAIYGTEGTLVVEPYAGGRLWRADANQPGGQAVALPPADPTMTGGPAHFIARLRDGRPFHPMCEAEACRDVQAILETARESAARQAPVLMNPAVLSGFNPAAPGAV